MATVIGVATAIVALITAILGVFKYFDVRSKRQQREAVGAAFKGIVATLAGTDRVERLGSAILLRRFFSPSSEYSKPDMPYADEAVDVIAATLRGEPTGDVQKVLADGLAYVGDRGLRHKDFQHVNLSGGYLSLSGPAGHAVARASDRRPADERRAGGRRTRASAADRAKSPRLDVGHADFFEADISGASFAEDDCVDTVFYRASAVGAVFRDTDLTDANFRDADLRRAKFDGATLLGAEFEGAKLAGARFTNAKDIPDSIVEYLDNQGVYEATEQAPVRHRVFVSAPSVSAQTDRDVVGLACAFLWDAGVEPVRVQPETYNPDRHLFDVKEAMAGCVGLVTVGLPQLAVTSGTWRHGTDDQLDLANEVLHTPWNDIETGIAAGLGIPILSIRAGCGKYGVFGLGSQAVGFEQVDPVDSRTDDNLANVIRSWTQRALPSVEWE
jgi:Pentapeptide repeats (9 copies)